jgi:hypothetical protein
MEASGASSAAKPARVTRDTRTLVGAFRVFLLFPTPRLIASALVVTALFRGWLAGWTAWDVPVALAVMVFWPWQEWYLHKVLLHWKPRKILGLQVDPVFARRHRTHHHEPHDLTLIFLPVTVVVVAIPISALISWTLMPTVTLAVTGLCTWFAMGLLYEWIHFLTHTQYTPRSNFYRRVQMNHMRHHFKNEHHWFSFTWPWFDVWFGTSPDPKTVPTSPTCRDLHGELAEHVQGD